MKYSKLFSKGRIGSCHIKNRIVMPPMTPGYTEMDGQPSERLIRYYEERAKGGVGLIYSEIFCVNAEHGHAAARQLNVLNPGNLTSVQQMVDRIHRYDCKFFAQLHHGGNTNSPERNGGVVRGVSEVPNVSGIVPVPFTTEEIESLVQDFIRTAVSCKNAGFDGVELHGAHGYLVLQFLSRYFNTRTDKYGGDYEGRARFAVEIIQGIKAACGKDYPVTVRMSADEYSPFLSGSVTLEDSIEFAKIFERAGADALNVSACNYYSIATAIEPATYEQGWRKGNSLAIKNAVSIPVISTNTIKDPAFAESLLEEGVCDFVATGRAQLADPEWSRKAKEGRDDEIRKCIGCLCCFEGLFTPVASAVCTVNPRLGREYQFNNATMERNGNGRVIAVVGGGPAGMQASITLAQRGFDVTLFDDHDDLGGTMNVIVKLADYKQKIARLNQTMQLEMKKAGVKLKLGKAVTTEDVAEIEPEAVFLACGAKPIVPNIPGICGKNVYLARDVVAGKVMLGGKVVVVGGGQTGLEAAEKMNMNGVRDIVIADMAPSIGTGMYFVVAMDLLNRLQPYNPVLMPNHMLTGIDDHCVYFKNTENDSDVKVEADSVVISLGVKPDPEILEAYEEKFDRVVPLGDAVTSGKIGDAIRTAYIAAFGFDSEV